MPPGTLNGAKEAEGANESNRSSAPQRHSSKRLWYYLTAGIGMPSVALILLGQGSSWIGEICVSWSLPALLFLVPALVMFRHQRMVVIGIVVVMILGLWPWILAACEGRAIPVTDRNKECILITANLYDHNQDNSAATQAVLDLEGDIVGLQETTAISAGAIKVSARWPYQTWSQRGLQPVALLSSYPITATTFYDLEGYACLQAQIVIPDCHPLNVLVAHLRSPKQPQDQQQRDRQLASLTSLILGITGPVVVMGDFNLSSAAPRWRQFIAESGLRRARGWNPVTWPSWFGPCGTDLDHMAGGNGLGLHGMSSFVIPGSDHLGLTATVQMPRLPAETSR